MNKTAERVLDLFQGARLTPTQRRIAHYLVQNALDAAHLSAAEVADMALYLVSDKAAAVTGQCINVDCGVLPQ